ncbi:MAG: hypothetical protein JNG88_13160, partial [Phycisphaerales bacterium]|nr:hypothetical protein [Phycisphaerales bacterium]
ADLTGTILVTGDVEGILRIRGGSVQSAGLIQVDGDVSGTVQVEQAGGAGNGGDMAGAIVVGGTLVGGSPLGASILIGDDLSGNVAVGGDLTNGARIYVRGSMNNGSEAEIEIAGTTETDTAVVVDYNGWHFGDDWGSGATVVIGATTYTGNTPSAHVWEIQPCRGDMNNDGQLNNFDIDPFVLALVDPDGYEAEFPGLEGSMVYHGDCNCSTTFNNFDLDPFVDLLSEGCCTTDCEPCEGFGPGGGESSAQEVAALLADGVATERYDAVLSIISEIAASDEPTAEFWSEVLETLGG